MQQPFWKRWLSYLLEIHIESAPSALNPHLYVSLCKGRYQLSSARAVYSFADLYRNFFEVFRLLEPQTLPPQQVLLLGFGLGSIPYMLEKNYGVCWSFTGVEADENVLYLANKYVLDELQCPMELICADAYAFLLSNQRRFDLIAMDVFVDNEVPEKFESLEFLQALARALQPHGLLLYNRLYGAGQERDHVRAFFQRTFQKQFPEGKLLELGDNCMLLNRPLKAPSKA